MKGMLNGVMDGAEPALFQNGTNSYFRNGLSVDWDCCSGKRGSGFLLWGEPGLRWVGFVFGFFWQAVKSRPFTVLAPSE
jgi:hypothetical protein